MKFVFEAERKERKSKKYKEGITCPKCWNKLSDSQKKLNEENLKALHQEDNDGDDDNVSEYVIDDDDKSVSDWSMTPSQIEEQERARKEREEEKKRAKREKKGKLKLAELSPEELLIREKARQRRKFLCKICGFCFCLILAVLVPVVYYYYIEPRYITMPTDAGKQVFISIEDARKLKYVTILDCRNKVSDASIPNSIHTPWTMFTDDPESGLLSADNVIQTKFQQLGIDKTYTTIVYGDWNHAWGEELPRWQTSTQKTPLDYPTIVQNYEDLEKKVKKNVSG